MRPPSNEPSRARLARACGEQQLPGVVGEDLQRHGGRVQTLGTAVFDDGPGLGGQLIDRDRLDDGHGDNHSLRATGCAPQGNPNAPRHTVNRSVSPRTARATSRSARAR